MENFVKLGNWVKFPLALLVVCIHTVGPELKAGFAVPCFFVMSGYLFFYHSYGKVSFSFFMKKWSRRLTSLLLPYVLWILLYYFYMRIFESEKLDSIMAGRNFFSIFWDANEIASIPLLGPFWYIRDLMKCIIITPIIYYAVRWTKGLIAPALLLFYVLAPAYGLYIKWWGNVPVAFFTLGVAITVAVNTDRKLTGWLYLLVLTFCAVLCYYLAYIHTVWHWQVAQNLYHVVMVMWVFGLAAVAERYSPIKIPAFLTESSFFIYSVHMFFYTAAFSIVRMLHVSGGSRMIATPLVIAFSLLTYFILYKYTPKFLSILMGGRIVKK